MGLESATYIKDLITTNPTGSDPASSSDDHHRLVKSVLRNTFPNLDGPVNFTPAELNGRAPLASPAFTGTPTAPTPASTDNTTKLATTAWAKFGFAVLLSVNGYIKFPSWLGGLVIQWGQYASATAGDVALSFPIAFPTAVYARAVTAATPIGLGNTESLNFWSGSATTTSMTICRRYISGTSGPTLSSNDALWIAIGN